VAQVLEVGISREFRSMESTNGSQKVGSRRKYTANYEKSLGNPLCIFVGMRYIQRRLQVV
jgi:hypothetical protein